MKFQELLAVLFILVATTAMADMPSFQTLDKNKDKLLSKQEVETVLSGVNFASADKNKDGTLDQKEYAALMKQLRKIKDTKS